MNKISLIGNAHLDPVWLWRWQEGFSEIKATFQSALDRMDENPNFIFTCAGASYYKWVEENCPEMFAKIKERVAEGRWVIVGGMWIQPDCNLPSGESFARQCLYSQQYYAEKFGVTAKVGYNVDSFGHNLMLPQILAKSGMNSYVFMRPGVHENDIGKSLFWWQSPDGSRVMTYRIPIAYTNAGLTKDQMTSFINDCTSAVTKEQDADMMVFYGVGNHGGGPTARQLCALDEIIAESSDFSYEYSSPDAYFEQMHALSSDLMVWRDDLQHHASGCYAAVSERKALNRLAENRLTAAEAMSVMAGQLMNQPYQRDLIYRAWDNVMFNQFHDIMGGCSIREAYQDAREMDGESLSIAAKLTNSAAQRISWSINTMGEEPFTVTKENHFAKWEVENRGTPIVVFNPLPYAVNSQVKVNQPSVSVSDENGNAVAHQIVRGSRSNGGDKWDTLFNAEIPGYGYRVYRSYDNKKFEAPKTNDLSVSVNHLENKNLRVEFKNTTNYLSGYISALINKATGEDVFTEAAMLPIVIDDFTNDTWSHGVFTFDKVVGYFHDAVIEVRESGSIRACLRVTSYYNKSKLILDYSLTPVSDALDINVILDWREDFKILKFAFPLAGQSHKTTYEIPFGSIERPLNGEEEPGLAWADISALNDSHLHGLTVVNTAKYSYSAANGELRVTAARSGVYADHYASPNHDRDELTHMYDHGIQEFKMQLIPHTGGLDKAYATRKAQMLNNPLFYIQETYHKGILPEIGTGIEISSSNITVSALKESEDGEGYILRAYETNGTPGSCTFTLPYIGAEFSVIFGSYEVKTCYISKKSLKVEERLITEVL